MTTPRIIDNDFGNIIAAIDGNEIRGWEYLNSTEHAWKMQMAHEFAEGWFQANKHDKQTIATLVTALDHAEAVMSIVEPRSNKKEYLETLFEIRAARALAKEKKP